MLPVATEAIDRPDMSGPDPAVWLVGAHGGAGVSTLAHCFAPMGDAGQSWPGVEKNLYSVLVCRSTKHGLERCHQAALQAQAGQAGSIALLGIIIVGDAPGKCPKSLEQKISVITEHFTVWRIPYLPALRITSIGDLAQWRPGQAPTERKRRPGVKKPACTDVVPPELATVADHIFTLALEKRRATG